MFGNKPHEARFCFIGIEFRDKRSNNLVTIVVTLKSDLSAEQTGQSESSRYEKHLNVDIRVDIHKPSHDPLLGILRAGRGFLILQSGH